jgi:hypothetical protein
VQRHNSNCRLGKRVGQSSAGLPRLASRRYFAPMVTLTMAKKIRAMTLAQMISDIGTRNPSTNAA